MHKDQRPSRRHLDAADGRLLVAKAKWSRLTPGALSGIANKQDLITGVELHATPRMRQRCRKWSFGMSAFEGPTRRHHAL